MYVSSISLRSVRRRSRGIPSLASPRLSDLSLELVSSALAISLIIVVQGVGVSQSAPNPDGSPRQPSRDFVAQGAANIASGFVGGLPVGGSLSTTALSVTSGASSRWAAVFAGIMMAVVVLILKGPVRAFEVTPIVGESTRAARADAEAWLVEMS